MNRNLLRWTPAVLAPVIIAATAVGLSVTASADVVLPEKSASQILQLIASNPTISFSGKVTKVANLGLPNINLIPNISQATVDQMAKNMPKGTADFLPKATIQDSLTTAIGFLAGTQQANIYVDGTTKARVQILDPMSERDLIRNGSDLWYYDAGKQTASHHALTAAEQNPDTKMLALDSATLPFDINSPAAIADYLIKEASATTDFTVGRAARVAGQDAYTLTMRPKSADSLIDSVTISVDAANGLPLGVSVYAVGQSSAAFELSFDSIDFSAPSSSIFAFTPPAGTKLTEVATPVMASEPKATEHAPTAAEQVQLAELGQAGWSAVVQVPADQAAPALQAIKNNTLYADLTKPVIGGRVFSTALLNILITDDGRLFAGAVTTAKLLQTAAR